jgi:hypothetical protein
MSSTARTRAQRLQTQRSFVTLTVLVVRAVSAWCAVVLCASNGEAFTLRVLAPTELRVAPTVRPDRLGVRLALSLRDDKGAGVRGTVRVESGTRPPIQARTDNNGHTNIEIAVSPGTRVVDLRAQFAGDSTHSAAISQLRIDLDAPFVSVSLLAPSSVDIDGRAAIDLIASVDTGAVAAVNPRGWVVQFYVDGDRVATSEADATGRAATRIDNSRFVTPGVRAVRAAVVLRGSELFSPERRLIARALTSIVATPTRDERTGQLGLRGAVAWRGGGVAGATVRVESNRQLLAAALTDRNGSFDLVLPARVLVAGARARVVFVPTTPWFSGAESGEFYLAPPALAAVSWRFALAPIGLGLLAFAIVRALRNRRESTPPAAKVEDGATLEHVEGDSEATLAVSVEDRTTGLPIEGATVLLDGTPLASGERRPVVRGAKVKVSVLCEGYAPREISVRIERSQAARLRIALAPWREAVFEVAREHLPSQTGGKVSPTLREAVETTTEGPKVLRPLFDAAERGAYGPTEPDQQTVAAVRALADRVRDGEH